MKKLIASIAALSMCALMLTACGDKTNAGDSGLTESITAEQTAKAADTASAEEDSKSDETEADKTEENKSDETEADNAEDSDPDETDAGSPDAAVSYGSLDEFYEADDVFSHPSEDVEAEKTNTYAFGKSFEDATDFYADLESSDGKMKIVMAMSMETKQIAIDIEGVTDESSGITNMSIILTDGKMYMLEPSSKSGFYMELDDEQLAEMFDEYDPEELLAEANIDTSTDFEGMMCYNVDIGGKTYTFEYIDNTGMLYDSNGKMCAVIVDDPSSEFRAIVVNEFSTKASPNAFDIPSGYEIFDMAELFG